MASGTCEETASAAVPATTLTDVPRSRIRRRHDYTPPPERKTGGSLSAVSQRWVVPTMLTLMIAGLIWLVIYYLASEDIPFMRDLGPWNLGIGMGLIIAGFIVSTRWK